MLPHVIAGLALHYYRAIRDEFIEANRPVKVSGEDEPADWNVESFKGERV